jgi:hypothetical protein
MALDARGRDRPTCGCCTTTSPSCPTRWRELVAALDADPGWPRRSEAAVTGTDAERLQSVGWTIDVTGRADSGVDPGELDQGQRDQRPPDAVRVDGRDAARREVFDELGGFDRASTSSATTSTCAGGLARRSRGRGGADAVGAHVGAASELPPARSDPHLGPRYFAERNTLATLLKNYGAAAAAVARRPAVPPRRGRQGRSGSCSHAGSAMRGRRCAPGCGTCCTCARPCGCVAWSSRVTTRVRAYAEAVAFWVTGGDHVPAPADEALRTEPAGPRRGRTAELLRSRPVMLAGFVLVTAVMVGTWPLLVPGEIRGGQLAPWPSSPAAFLEPYLSGWNDGAAFGTSATPSPAQALLGLLHLAVGGSTYLAPRVLLFGAVAAAWVFALRAAQQYSPRRVPRVVAATAYVLSPPSLAALATGQVDALVLMAVIPGVAAAGVTFSDRRSSPAQAWRAVSAATLLVAVGAAFEPWLLALVVLAGLAMMLLTFASGAPGVWQRALAARVLAAMVAPFVLLLPWTLDLVDPAGPLFDRPGTLAGGTMAQWLALSPELAGFPGLVAGAGFVLAGLLGLAIGLDRAPGLVVALWLVALGGAAAGWWLGRLGAVMWPGLPLLLTAAAFAALFALAFASAEAQLGRFGFGWRQIGAAITAAAVVVSVVAVALEHVRSGLDAYALGDEALPAFIGTAAGVEDFRVLVLADQPDGIAWEVVPGAGPSMASVGVPPSPALRTVEKIVDDTVARRDPWAAARLGLLNVRFVVVPQEGTSDALDAALRGQLALEPRPVSSGRVHSVVGWLPRASVVLPTVAWRLAEDGRTDGGFEATPLVRAEPGRYLGTSPVRGTVLVGELDDGMWQARVDGQTLEQIPMPRSGTLAFRPVGPDQAVEVVHTRGDARGLQVAGQVLALLLVVSLALRPPRFARQRRALPAAEPQLVRATEQDPHAQDGGGGKNVSSTPAERP